jgi:dTDP-4-dehydrorhamnose reductase
MKPILLFGSTGQLGTDLAQAFSDLEIVCYGPDDINLNRREQIEEAVQEHRPEWIINASAYNNVQQAEVDPHPAFAVNAHAVWEMARQASRLDACFVHFSTDYVFPGDKGSPYVESDQPRPLNVYAVSKLSGEYLAMNTHRWFIFRLSALFGLAGCLTKGGSTFVNTILDKAERGEPIQVVDDKICTPTFTLDVARYLKENLFSLEPGLYHLVNDEPCSWFEFAKEIVKQAGVEATVEPHEDQGILRRPMNSALASEKIPPLRPWKEALAEYLDLQAH